MPSVGNVSLALQAGGIKPVVTTDATEPGLHLHRGPKGTVTVVIIDYGPDLAARESSCQVWNFLSQSGWLLSGSPGDKTFNVNGKNPPRKLLDRSPPP